MNYYGVPKARIALFGDSANTNLDAEAVVLSGLMFDNRLADRAAAIVRPDMFADPVHAAIYEAALTEIEAGGIATPVTLLPRLADSPAVPDGFDVRDYLANITGSGAAIIGCLDCARQVFELWQRRQFEARLGDVYRASWNADNTPERLAEMCEAAGAELLETVPAGRSGPVHIYADSVLTAAARDADEGAPGVSYGSRLPSLLRVLGTIRPGWLVYMAARPAQGKTSTALNLVLAAAEAGQACGFFSLEMRGDELAARFACAYLFGIGRGVPYERFTDGGASPEQRREIARAFNALKELPIWIEDLPTATVAQLQAAVRRCARRFAGQGQTLALAVVDYLQLVRPNDREKDLYQAISAVSRGLKAIAKAEGVGVLALCQLSRSVEQRADKRPIIADLRDSGQIEQDADAICFLLRKETYLLREQPREAGAVWEEWNAAFSKERGRIEFIVPKRRFGREGSAFGEWHGEFQAVAG